MSQTIYLTDRRVDLLIITAILGPNVTSRDVHTALESLTHRDSSTSSTVATLAHLAECGLVTMKSDPQRWSVKPGVVNARWPRVAAPPCDFASKCDNFAVADARLHTGQWGNVCFDCFDYFSCDLGVGKGQLIVSQAQADEIKARHAQSKCNGERTGHHSPECDAEADRRRNQS